MPKKISTQFFNSVKSLRALLVAGVITEIKIKLFLQILIKSRALVISSGDANRETINILLSSVSVGSHSGKDAEKSIILLL